MATSEGTTEYAHHPVVEIGWSSNATLEEDQAIVRALFEAVRGVMVAHDADRNLYINGTLRPHGAEKSATPPISRLREQLEAATPTPWGHGNRGHHGGGVARTGEFTKTGNGMSPDFIGVFESAERNPVSMANDDLIVAAVNALPILLDVAEAVMRVGDNSLRRLEADLRKSGWRSEGDDVQALRRVLEDLNQKLPPE